VQLGRKVDPTQYRYNEEYTRLIDMLVPYGDELFRTYRIEQLVQLVLRSDMADRLEENDPVNLYTRAPLQFPEPSSTNTEAPVTITHLTDKAVTQFEQQGVHSVEVTVNPGSLTLESDVTGIVSFTYSNLLSNAIEILPGRSIRMQGPLPGTPFTFVINYVGDTLVDWPALIKLVDSQEYNWTDATLREFFQNDINWINRVAAVVLLAVENSSRDS
jgi:hypothetical protein